MRLLHGLEISAQATSEEKITEKNTIAYMAHSQDGSEGCCEVSFEGLSACRLQANSRGAPFLSCNLPIKFWQ